MESFIGKVIRAKFIEKRDRYYIAKEVGTDINVFVEDEGEYYEEELIGNIEKCIIVDELKGNYIAFILSNRKFVNDIKYAITNDTELSGCAEKIIDDLFYNNANNLYLSSKRKIYI